MTKKLRGANLAPLFLFMLKYITYCLGQFFYSLYLSLENDRWIEQDPIVIAVSIITILSVMAIGGLLALWWCKWKLVTEGPLDA